MSVQLYRADFQSSHQTTAVVRQKARKKPPTSIFYCNGMTTTKAEARKAADKVAEIAGQKVHLHFNDTTPTSRVVKGGIEGVAGAGCVTYALCSEKKTGGQKAFAFAMLLLGVGLSADAILDHQNLQDEKEVSAHALAEKVEQFLAKHPRRMATLVLHSQGAHIGYTALERLRPSRDRINVITIGSMVKIPGSFGRRVENLRHTRDLVSKGAHAIFDATLHKARKKRPGPNPGHRSITHISQTRTDCTICHGARDYISSRPFQRTLRDFTQSNRGLRA